MAVEREEGVVLLSGGRARITVGDDSWTLRAPTMGELRTVRERLLDLAEQLDAEADSLADTENMGPNELAVRQGLGGSDADEGAAALMVDIIDMLTGEGGPDEAPAWFGNVALPVRLVGHWRAVPLVPGS